MVKTEIDEEELRDKSIRRLQKAILVADRMTRNPRFNIKEQQSWFKRYTDTILALNKLLKDREEKDWEKRLVEVLEYRKKAANQRPPKTPDPQENNPSVQPENN